MKAVLQRVHSASVAVDNQLVNKIGKGILVFAAVSKDDTTKEADSMAVKLLKFKMWDNWKKSVKDIDGEVLCVSQFTLLASTKKGNKPDFHKSASAEKAREIYDHFVNAVKEQYQAGKVKNGVFQAMMDVSLVNDGPVTFELNVDPPSAPLDESNKTQSNDEAAS